MAVGSTVLKPQQSTQITISIGIDCSGPVMASVRLLTNDATRPVAYVTLHGKVPYNVRLLPEEVRFTSPKGDVVAQRVILDGPEEMELKSAACRDGAFDVRITRGPAAPGTARWSVDRLLRDGDVPREVRDELRIHTTHPDRPLITVPITGEVRGDLDLRPAQVFFGFVRVGDKAEQAVTIASRSRATFTVEASNLEGAGLRVAEPVRAEDGSWRVTIALAAQKPGIIDANLVLTTDVPGEGTLEVPVYAHVVAPQS